MSIYFSPKVQAWGRLNKNTLGALAPKTCSFLIPKTHEWFEGKETGAMIQKLTLAWIVELTSMQSWEGGKQGELCEFKASASLVYLEFQDN